MTRALLERCLNALEYHQSQTRPIHNTELVIDAIRAYLAKPQGEPAAWKWRYADGDLSESPFESRSECERDAIGYEGEAIPLFTHPAAPQAQPSKQVLENIDEVMTQAQVMASAWSLVGSRFDSGSAMQDFEEAKQELRDMLSAAPEPVAHDNCVPVAVLVETDSGVMVWPIRDSAEACTYCDPDETPQMLYLHPAAPQAQPAHTEAEVQELLNYFKVYMCYSAEGLVRRILNVPAPEDK